MATAEPFCFITQVLLLVQGHSGDPSVTGSQLQPVSHEGPSQAGSRPHPPPTEAGQQPLFLPDIQFEQQPAPFETASSGRIIYGDG